MYEQCPHQQNFTKRNTAYATLTVNTDTGQVFGSMYKTDHRKLYHSDCTDISLAPISQHITHFYIEISQNKQPAVVRTAPHVQTNTNKVSPIVRAIRKPRPDTP